MPAGAAMAVAQLGGKTMSRRKAAMPIGTATLTDTAFCTI